MVLTVLFDIALLEIHLISALLYHLYGAFTFYPIYKCANLKQISSMQLY